MSNLSSRTRHSLAAIAGAVAAIASCAIALGILSSRAINAFSAFALGSVALIAGSAIAGRFLVARWLARESWHESLEAAILIATFSVLLYLAGPPGRSLARPVTAEVQRQILQADIPWAVGGAMGGLSVSLLLSSLRIRASHRAGA